MIVSVEKLRSQVDCGDLTDEVISSRLEAIESVVREYTHNNFQQRFVRFAAISTGNELIGDSSFFKAGDTVQISQSKVNDGLYTVISVEDNRLIVDAELNFSTYNLVTKIQYPYDVVQVAVDLFEWKQKYGGKIGVKSESETLSRHSESVTYEDSATLFMGYPTGILRGLNLHRKARF